MAASLPSETDAETRPAYIPSHGRGRLRPFQPGQSGNTTGKGAAYHAAQKICRDASPAAARKLVELMEDSDSRIALMAADKIMDRAWGKPKWAPQEPAATATEDAERAEAKRKFMELIDRMSAPAASEEGRCPLHI